MHFTDKRADASAEQIVTDVGAYLESNGITGATAESTAPTIEDTFIARMGAPEGDDDRSKQRGAA